MRTFIAGVTAALSLSLMLFVAAVPAEAEVTPDCATCFPMPTV